MLRPAPDAALLTLLAEARERAVARELDPAADPAAARALVADVVSSREQGWLTGDGPRLADRATAEREVYDALAGYGPLQPLLADPEVEEVWVNADDRVFAARRGRSELTTVVLRPGQLREVLERMLASSGRRLDTSQPFCDATLPDGSRLHVVIPDVTAASPAVNIRLFGRRRPTLADLVGAGSLPHGVATFLEASVVAGLNLVVAGGVGAGKTTLLGGLLGAVPPQERIVTCEEVFELRLPNPDWVALQTRQPSLEGTGEIRLRRLVIEALRMRPDRLVVGEVRAEEALDLLLALTSGQPGMTTVHASSAREAVTKLCTLPLLAGPNVTSGFVVPTVANAVDLVVHVRREPSGVRRVTEVAAVTGRVEGDVVEVAPVFGTVAGQLVRAGGGLPHGGRFAERGRDLHQLLAA